MSVDLNLPTFGLDCRDWLVATEAEGLLVDQPDGAPVLAVLSTAVVAGAELHSAQAVFSLALLDDDAEHEIDVRENAYAGDAHRRADERAESGSAALDQDGSWTGQDICVLHADWDAGFARFAVPAPGGELAVVAEFSSAPGPSRELIDRFYDLVTSFRWAA